MIDSNVPVRIDFTPCDGAIGELDRLIREFHEFFSNRKSVNPEKLAKHLEKIVMSITSDNFYAIDCKLKDLAKNRAQRWAEMQRNEKNRDAQILNQIKDILRRNTENREEEWKKFKDNEWAQEESMKENVEKLKTKIKDLSVSITVL